MVERSLLQDLGVVDGMSWRSRWYQRLQDLHLDPPIDPLLLWGLALPMLTAIERQLASADASCPVLALTAPVGAGKSTLGRQLQVLAAAAGLQLAVASIDDAYLDRAQRRLRLAGNPFGVSRVPPGSHDADLLLQAIDRWQQGGALVLPRFDKTLCGGEGDRSGFTRQQADALVLEGWLVGYEPLGGERLSGWLDPGRPLSAIEQEWLPRWDQNLEAYRPLWRVCDSFWVLQPSDWDAVLGWRLQAEARQCQRGGASLSEAAIRNLVRASLASLPPELYQPSLLERATAVATLDPQRQCLRVDPRLERDQDQSSLSSSLTG